MIFASPLPTFECPSMDGQNFIVRGALFYKSLKGDIYCVPDGSTTDGPSIPSWLINIVSPFGYDMWGASMFHDAWFRGFLLTWSGIEFVPCSHNAAEATSLFNEIMERCGMPVEKRDMVFFNVKAFGEIPFEHDLSLIIPKLIIPKQLPAEYATT